jgi:hypothetical protein
MSPAPVVHETSRKLYDALGGGFTDRDEENGWQLLMFLDTFGAQLGEIDDIVRDTAERGGWSLLFDVDNVPAKFLPWLGQFIGAEVDTSLPEEEQRLQLKSVQGFQRGRPASIIQAAKAFLTGSKKVILEERWTSAYTLRVRVYRVQAPDPAKVEAFVRKQKPGSLVLTFETLPADLWSEVADPENFATWQNVKDAFATWNDLRNWVAP